MVIDVKIFGGQVVKEDSEFVVSVGLQERDTDGSEVVGETAYLRIDSGATLLGNYAIVADDDEDSVVLGQSVVGFARVPTDQVSNIRVQPPENWHGDVELELFATAYEPSDDEDGDHIKLERGSTIVTVIPVADEPVVEIPAEPVAGFEGSAIALPGLAVRLNDNVRTNGGETLSATLSGVPLDSILNVGSNNGDGSWSVPHWLLSTLQITPPPHFAGTMTLTLTGIALELSRGYSEASTSRSFEVLVEAVADQFLMVAETVLFEGTAEATTEVDLHLNVRALDERGYIEGELPPERISISFTDIPDGLYLFAKQGGTLLTIGEGAYNFTGTPAQANKLSLVRCGGVFVEPAFGQDPTPYTVNIVGLTSDSGTILENPVLDTLTILAGSLDAPDNARDGLGETLSGSLVTGTPGNDVIEGTSGDDELLGGSGQDIIRGGPGSDTMTGGDDRDIFRWNQGDIGSLDLITDFQLGTDKLDLTGLATVVDWTRPEGQDPIPSPEILVDKYVKLTENENGSTTVAVDESGSGLQFVDLVTLQGLSGLSLTEMVADGSIMI